MLRPLFSPLFGPISTGDISFPPKGGGDVAPAGFVFLTDIDGSYLTDPDGSYLMEAA